jgi:hypothetical protein
MNREELIERITKAYKESWGAWDKLEICNFNDEYEEEYEDTLTRKYEEGFSDALRMVLDLMKEEKN